MKTIKSYWNYLPIVLTLIIGFIAGGYLSFGTVFLDAFPDLKNATGRFLLMLFGIGVLGSTSNCAQYWAKDIDEAVYKDNNYLPHIFDFAGYVTLIVGGGITGIILYFLVRTGANIAVTSNNSLQLTTEVSIVIAYCGGLYHFKVHSKLEEYFKNLIGKGRNERPEDGTS